MKSIVITPELVGQRVAVFVGIETKSPKGVRSPAQIAFGASLERVGAIYVLARTVDDIVGPVA